MPDSTTNTRPLRLAVFVGPRGRGSNLAAIYDAIKAGRLAAHIVLVVGSNADAPALLRAQDAGLQTAVVNPKSFNPDAPDGYAHALLTHLQNTDTDTIALAGYLRRLPSSVLAHFQHRVVNVHPSLLPAFGGKGMYGHHVHDAVLAYGAKVSGCTVHFVDETYDTGPVIVQKSVPVAEGDTPETLAARILPCEHEAFIQALQWLAEGRLQVEGRVVRVRGT